MTTSASEVSGNCVTCGAPLTGKFCAACGEKRPGPDDYKLGHFADDAVESFTHADGKVFRSMALLLSRPGRLTAEYLRGRRKPYLKPLALFLVANTIFFLALPLLGWNTLTTPLQIHLHNELYSPLARAVFAHRFPAGVEVPADYVREFNHHGALLAKSLVIVMVPLFALLVWACFVRARRHYLEHVVFGLHFYAFWLLYLVASLGLTNGVLRLIVAAGGHPSDLAIDNTISLLGLGIVTLFIYHAVRTVYGGSGRAALVKALILAIGVNQIVQVYRCFLFFVTYWTT